MKNLKSQRQYEVLLNNSSDGKSQSQYNASQNQKIIKEIQGQYNIVQQRMESLLKENGNKAESSLNKINVQKQYPSTSKSFRQNSNKQLIGSKEEIQNDATNFNTNRFPPLHHENYNNNNTNASMQTTNKQYFEKVKQRNLNLNSSRSNNLMPHQNISSSGKSTKDTQLISNIKNLANGQPKRNLALVDQEDDNNIDLKYQQTLRKIMPQTQSTKHQSQYGNHFNNNQLINKDQFRQQGYLQLDSPATSGLKQSNQQQQLKQNNDNDGLNLNPQKLTKFIPLNQIRPNNQLSYNAGQLTDHSKTQGSSPIHQNLNNDLPQTQQRPGSLTAKYSDNSNRTIHFQSQGGRKFVANAQTQIESKNINIHATKLEIQNPIANSTNVGVTVAPENTLQKQIDDLFCFPMPKLDPSKCSTKENGTIVAYAANTHQGLIRNYNEDRVSIILNIVKPTNKNVDKWPSCSFFAVYDGHAGAGCADFLRDNLHHFIINDLQFPENPAQAIKNGCEKAERNFLQQAESQNGNMLDKSGSCAIFVLIVDSTLYIGNVGDSRAFMSEGQNNLITGLSLDHKPNEESEEKRIVANGGRIYQSQGPKINNNPPIVGPHRVLPGRLSVSRTFGDIIAKVAKYGGNPKVIIAVPDIRVVKISSQLNYIILGCDGVFDKLSNQEAGNIIFSSLKTNKCSSYHESTAMGTDQLMHQTLVQKSLDNITLVMISFQHIKEIVKYNAINNQSVKQQVQNKAGSMEQQNKNTQQVLHSHNQYINNIISNQQHAIIQKQIMSIV